MDHPQPYALFLVTGLFPWIWASSSLLEGTVALSTNAGLIKKAKFPLEILPVVTVFSNLAHFLLALPILLGALIYGRLQGAPVLGWVSLWLPAVVLLQLVATSGLTLGLSALNAHFKDIRDLLANLLQLLFFLAPILYSLEQFSQRPLLSQLIRANPFAPFAIAYQKLLFWAQLPDWTVWTQMAGVALVAWGSRRLAVRALERHDRGGGLSAEPAAIVVDRVGQAVSSGRCPAFSCARSRALCCRETSFRGSTTTPPSRRCATSR